MVDPAEYPTYVPSGESTRIRDTFDAMLNASGPGGPRGVEPLPGPGPFAGIPDGLDPGERMRREVHRTGSATCPRCDGGGVDPAGGDCVMCHGHGTI